jgi:hypothetical protein
MDPKDSINTVKEIQMSKVYKMIYRDEENPDTHALHVVERYVRAESRNQARELFETSDKSYAGPHHVVAGPIGPLEDSQIAKDAIFV